VNRGGYLSFQEFCEWIEAAEKRAGTPVGVDLGVNEPLDSPYPHGVVPYPGDMSAPNVFSDGSAGAERDHVARARAGRRLQR
jgi:hypothetical protein